MNNCIRRANQSIELTDEAGAALTGRYEFQFHLYDGSGSGAGQIGSTVTVHDKEMDDGLFTVQLDFGDVFDREARWLEAAAPLKNGGYFMKAN